MKKLNRFFVLVVLLAVVGLSSMSYGQEQHGVTFVKPNGEVVKVTPEHPATFTVSYLSPQSGIWKTDTITAWVEVEEIAKGETKGEIHINMCEAINLMDYPRINPDDVFVLHESGEPGVFGYTWADDEATILGELPDATCTIAESYVGWILYDQSSTVTGYSYAVEFQLLDPIVTTHTANFSVDDEATSMPINNATVCVEQRTPVYTNSNGEVSVSDLEDGVYDFTVSKAGYDLYTGDFTISGDDVDVVVHMTATAAPLPGQAATPSGETSLCEDPANTSYATTGASDATSYTWALSPSNAGTITNNGTSCTIDWDDTFTGTANLTVTGVNATGNGPTSELLAITINPNPTADFNYSSTNLDVTFENTSSDAESYYWDFGDGNTSTEENPVHTYTGGGNYTVELTATNACGDAYYSETVLVTTAIGEMSDVEVSVYPNPVANTLFITDTEGFGSVSVYDIKGRLIYFAEVDGDVEVNFSNMMSGLYIVKLQTDKNILTYKISKQ